MQLSAAYLWFKALHVAFMVTWFAGLFYLPRLFIYHTDATDDVSRDRFETMERRLFIIMTIGMALTTLFGLLLLSINTALITQQWFTVKVLFLLGLFTYHYRCWNWISKLKVGNFPGDTRWLRWFNEIPVVFLLVVVCLAIVKTF